MSRTFKLCFQFIIFMHCNQVAWISLGVNIFRTTIDPQSTDVLDSGEATDQVGEGASSNEGSSSGASRDYRKVVVGMYIYTC